jgi:integrase
MRYVKRYRDAHGVERLYFRKAGHPQDGEALVGPWPEQPEGSALEVEVRNILGPQGPKAKPSNLAGATRAYELGADFGRLSGSTQYIYRLLLKDLDATLGGLPVAAFTPAFILSLRDAWAPRGHRAANLRLQVLKNVLSPQLIARDLPDPFSRIKQIRRPRDLAEPHPVWNEAVLRIVIEAAIEAKKYGLARAIALGRYVGARRGDIVRMKHSARCNGRVVFLSGKRRTQIDMPEDPILTEWLAVTPASQPLSKWQSHAERKTKVTRMPPTTLVFNISNLPYSEDGLGQELAKLIVKLHAEGRIDSDAYDLHGLRHTFGVEAALAGCSDAQGAALMGHGSPNSFATYRRQASRLRMSDDGAVLISALRKRASGTGPERDVSNEVSKSV